MEVNLSCNYHRVQGSREYFPALKSMPKLRKERYIRCSCTLYCICCLLGVWNQPIKGCLSWRLAADNGTVFHENNTLYLGFAGHREGRSAITRTALLSLDEPSPGTRGLKKKRQLFPACSVDDSEFDCVAAFGPDVPLLMSGIS